MVFVLRVLPCLHLPRADGVVEGGAGGGVEGGVEGGPGGEGVGVPGRGGHPGATHLRGGSVVRGRLVVGLVGLVVGFWWPLLGVVGTNPSSFVSWSCKGR